MATLKVPPYIEALRLYQPGKPLQGLALELGLTEILSMASNESAYGASPRVAEALQAELGKLHFYPDSGGTALKAKLAARHGVSVEQIVLGNGSGDLIETSIQTFAAAGEVVVMSRLGFIQVRLAARARGSRLVEVDTDPLTFREDPDRFATAAREARLVFLANPNNPTGTYWTKSQLDDYFAGAPGVLTVLDEAYAEYVERPDYPDGCAYLESGLPVIVLRTFSKIFGLAGLRIGYGIASPEVAGYLERVRSTFNTNHLAQAAALAALEDEAHVAWVMAENRQQRARLVRELGQRGARVTPSETNFLLVHPPDGRRWAEELLPRGVQVRAMDGWGLPGAVRITVGTPPQNTRLLAVLDELDAASGASR